MSRRVENLFRWIRYAIMFACFLCMVFWIFSSERYVSEATVLVQNAEQVATPGIDVATMLGGLGGLGGVNKPDQLLLLEHLLSVDMLKKLDEALRLRKHYSDTRWDFASRMWCTSIEWFHRYYLSRVSVTFDDYAGVLRIRAQAYDPQTAYAIAQMLVQEGERFMNEMSHALALTQVGFLERQVIAAQEQVMAASKTLLDFQNQKGLLSPRATVESLHAVIAKLEGQRIELKTQLESLPRNLDRNHPIRKSLEQSLQAVERQISMEQARLASVSGTALNALVQEEQRLGLELNFKKDIYKAALVGLEKGRMDAARTIKHVSILQNPLFPEYAVEPRRIYGIIATLCVSLLLLGIATLLKSVILDHVD